MTVNVLDPSALLQVIPNKLPPNKRRLESPQDAIAILIHVALTALGFRVIAVDENTPTRTFENNVLSDEWNQHGPGHYTFKYKHEQSSLEFVVKIIKLGSRTMINSIALESDKAATLDLSTNDFISLSFFPCDLAAAHAPLVHGFISSNRVADLMSQFQLTTVQKLIPGLRKEGYTESEDVSPNEDGSRSRPGAPPLARPQPLPDPFSQAPPRSPLAVPRNPLEVGRRDLDPFPHNPFQPTSLFPDNGDDGMFVGPNHPIFGPGMRGQGPGGRGPWGGDGFLPPLGAPPGARFDPVGPGPLPMPGRNPFPGRMPPGSGNTRDPDNDEFMPPGAGDMFM